MKRLMGLVSTNYTAGDFGYLTETRPIASIPYAGRYRLVDFPLSNLVNSGIHVVGLITPHLYRSLLDHVGNGKEWSLARRTGGLFILPGSTYGLRGAKGKFLLRDLVGNAEYLERSSRELVVVTASSKVYNIDFREVVEAHEKSGASITLLYKKRDSGEGLVDPSVNVDAAGKVTSISMEADGDSYNQFMDALVIERELLLRIISWYTNLAYLDLMDVITDNLDQLSVHAHEWTGYVKSIDSAADYMDASMELFDVDILTELFASERLIMTKVQDAYPTKYGPKSKVRNSMVAAGCIVNGTVDNSIVFRGCYIEKGAVIRNSVVMPNAYIDKDVSLENVICDKFVRMQEGVSLKGLREKPLIVTRKQYS